MPGNNPTLLTICDFKVRSGFMASLAGSEQSKVLLFQSMRWWEKIIILLHF
jgi:hypothetical protein